MNNILTHFFLSENVPGLLVGNFIGEVKTISDPDSYSDDIKAGIHFHEQIEKFIAAHPAIDRSKRRLNPKFSKYSSCIIDTFYDHFLAANWSTYHNLPLDHFARNTYEMLLDYHHILPFKAKNFLPVMIKTNWLEKLVNLSGIHDLIRDLSLKSTKETYTLHALQDLITHYNELY